MIAVLMIRIATMRTAIRQFSQSRSYATLRSRSHNRSFQKSQSQLRSAFSSVMVQVKSLNWSILVFFSFRD